MTNTETIPTSIAPWLSVRNSAKAIEFYKAAFGAVETYHLEDPDGNAVEWLPQRCFRDRNGQKSHENPNRQRGFVPY